MPVFSKVSGFFNRHRNKFIVGGALLGGTIFLSRYAQRKLREWQETETMEFLEKNRKRQHFDSIIRTCNTTALSLSGALTDNIAKSTNADEIIEKLKSNPEDKYELWNELKFLIFMKATCSIYSKVMLMVMLRIQLSLVGGYLYKNPEDLSVEEQEKYLNLCQNVIEQGFYRLHRVVEKVCRKILEPLDLTQQMKLSDIDAIFWSIQTGVGADTDNPIDNLREYLIPDLPGRTGYYDKLVQDTVDILKSDEVKSIAMHCVTRCFMQLAERISEFYTEEDLRENGTKPTTDFKNPFNGKKPLAKVLPILHALSTKLNNTPDQMLQQLVASEKLQVLSANIYECVL